MKHDLFSKKERENDTKISLQEYRSRSFAARWKNSGYQPSAATVAHMGDWAKENAITAKGSPKPEPCLTEGSSEPESHISFADVLEMSLTPEMAALRERFESLAMRHRVKIGTIMRARAVSLEEALRIYESGDGQDDDQGAGREKRIRR